MSVSKSSRSSIKSKYSKCISAKTASSSPDQGICKQNFKTYSDEAEYLFNNTGDAIRVINSDFTIRRINRAFAEMTDVGQDYVVGKKCWEIFPSPLCHTSDCRAYRVLNGEDKIRVEIERQRHNGDNIPCIVITSPLKDDAGNITGIVEQFRDITEIRHKEEEIKESEDRYRALIELGTEAGEAIIMLQDVNGLEGKFVFVSKSLLKTVGYSIEELLGMSIFQLISAFEKEFFLNRYRHEKSGATTADMFEITLICKDGLEKPVEMTSAITNYQGKQATVIYIRDITERRKIEQQLVNERKRYQSLFEHSPVATAEIDLSGVKIHLDYLRSIGVNNLRKYLYEHPDDPLLLHSYSTMWKFIAVNHATYEMLGKTKDTKDINRDYSKKFEFDPDVLENHIRYLTAFFEGKTLFENEISTNTMGKANHIQIKVSVPPGFEDTLSRVFITHHDITQLRETEKQLKEHQDQLEKIVEQRTVQLQKEIQLRKQEEEKSLKLYETEAQLRAQLQQQMEEGGEFIKAIVHEIKTPLSSIIASSEALLDGIDPSKTKLARNVLNGSLALNRRVGELTDIFKSGSGMLSLRCAAIDPQQLVNEITGQFLPNVNRKGQTLVVEMPSKLPALWGDNDRLQQVLYNLLSNALKFNKPQGKITVRVKADSERIDFEIEDEGIGISQADQANLFSPEKRLKQRKNYGGFGVGLALSKTFIELHNGKIDVISKENVGSVFHFYIPLDGKHKELGT